MLLSIIQPKTVTTETVDKFKDVINLTEQEKFFKAVNITVKVAGMTLLFFLMVVGAAFVITVIKGRVLCG